MPDPRICVIFNPAARGEKAARFRKHLDEFASDCTLKLTTGPGGAIAPAIEAVIEGFDTIIAAGGDGTVNEVLNGMGDVPGGLARARLGVMPLGTVNVFAKELGLPMNLGRAWQVIRQGRESRIDLPRVEYQLNGKRESRYFAQLAGVGMDARAIELVSWQLKKKAGPLAYVAAGLRALREKQARIDIARESEPQSGQLVLFGNGRYYGGKFHIFPHADLRDGLLDVCVFPRVGWRVAIHCGLSLLATAHLPRSRAHHFRTASIELPGPTGTPLEVDGEYCGQLPARFSIEPLMLRVVVP